MTTATIGLVILLVLNVLIWRKAFDSVAADPPSLRAAAAAPPTPAIEPSAEELQAEVDQQTVVVVIGDSFTSGSAMNSGPEWLDQIGNANGWITRDLSIGGTGYILGEPNADVVSRVANPTGVQADLVIFASGYNDVGKFPNAQIEQAARTAIEAASAAFPGADVLVLSPWSSGPPADLQRDMARRLRAVASDAGDPYLDVLDALTADQIGSDGIHPTDDGHRAMTAFMQAALDRLQLPRPDAYQLP